MKSTVKIIFLKLSIVQENLNLKRNKTRQIVSSINYSYWINSSKQGEKNSYVASKIYRYLIWMIWLSRFFFFKNKKIQIIYSQDSFYSSIYLPSYIFTITKIYFYILFLKKNKYVTLFYVL